MGQAEKTVDSYCHAEGMRAEELDREIFILDSRRGRIHALNTTAAALWHLMSEAATIEELAEDFHSAFPDTARTKLVREISKAVERMEAKGLVKRQSAARAE